MIKTAGLLALEPAASVLSAMAMAGRISMAFGNQWLT